MRPNNRGNRWKTREKHRKDRQKFTRDASESDKRVTAVPAQTHEVKKLLEGIGTPLPLPFKPDPFQLEALAALESNDVLVTAPTGSGKTWIAREEIGRLLQNGKRAWYTTPLKALTN